MITGLIKDLRYEITINAFVFTSYFTLSVDTAFEYKFHFHVLNDFPEMLEHIPFDNLIKIMNKYFEHY